MLTLATTNIAKIPQIIKKPFLHHREIAKIVLCFQGGTALAFFLSLSFFCHVVKLANYGCLRAHACGRGQIAPSSECVT